MINKNEYSILKVLSVYKLKVFKQKVRQIYFLLMNETLPPTGSKTLIFSESYQSYTNL